MEMHASEPSPIDKMRQAISELPPSPANNILKRKVANGTFERWLIEALQNNGELRVTEKDIQRGRDSYGSSINRRAFLSLGSLAAGAVGTMAAISTYATEDAIERGPALVDVMTRLDLLLNQLKHFLPIENPTKEQKARLREYVKACEKSKEEYDAIDLSDLGTMCLYLGLGSAAAGVVTSHTLGIKDGAQDIPCIPEMLSTSWCISKLQARLDKILRKHYPEVHQDFTIAREEHARRQG